MITEPLPSATATLEPPTRTCGCCHKPKGLHLYGWLSKSKAVYKGICKACEAKHRAERQHLIHLGIMERNRLLAIAAEERRRLYPPEPLPPRVVRIISPMLIHYEPRPVLPLSSIAFEYEPDFTETGQRINPSTN